MVFESAAERRVAGAISHLAYCNPFLRDRMKFEAEALGEQFVPGDAVWNALSNASPRTPNIHQIGVIAESLAASARERIVAGGGGSSESDLKLYEELVLYLLYNRSRDELGNPLEVITTDAGGGAKRNRKESIYPEFERAADHFLHLPGVRLPMAADTAHLFACFFQIRRAFHFTFLNIVGRSLAAAKLRASVWQSVFTHDMRRYFRILWRQMGDITTLITGPSGTGKELVASAIGLSRYIPFDPRTRTFTEDYAASFHPLNLSALSPTLIESELFGHRRGAFTGALEDRAGWLETCTPLGTVFLDEIGELDPQIQVKLLRVLQTRTFQRLGDTNTRMFRGKIIAATNRNLTNEIEAGRFRKDFYYRLCADMITTPSLREQLDASPTNELNDLILFISRRVIGDDAEEAKILATEVMTCINESLGPDYPWPGNFRELEQCVRNVLIRREYHPPHGTGNSAPAEQLTEAFMTGSLTADQLLRRYCTLIYGRTKNYEETARRLGLDRRTVKAKVDSATKEEEEILAADERG